MEADKKFIKDARENYAFDFGLFEEFLLTDPSTNGGNSFIRDIDRRNLLTSVSYDLEGTNNEYVDDVVDFLGKTKNARNQLYQLNDALCSLFGEIQINLERKVYPSPRWPRLNLKAGRLFGQVSIGEDTYYHPAKSKMETYRIELEKIISTKSFKFPINEVSFFNGDYKPDRNSNYMKNFKLVSGIWGIGMDMYNLQGYLIAKEKDNRLGGTTERDKLSDEKISLIDSIGINYKRGIIFKRENFSTFVQPNSFDGKMQVILMGIAVLKKALGINVNETFGNRVDELLQEIPTK